MRDLGFPMDAARTRVVLAEETNTGDATVAYKRGAVEAAMADGWDFQYAFGNASTDIQGYAEAGIDVDRTYIIGRNTGDGSTVPVAGEAWTDVITDLLDPQGRVCDF